MTACLFCNIACGTAPAFKVWEDDLHIAFLTPFPNTPGFSVIATKAHHSSYGFSVAPEVLTGLIMAARTVALMIDKNLKVRRTGLLMEGYGIDHLHVKLFPMHGINSEEWQNISSEDRTFYEVYQGKIASNDGPRMSDDKLSTIAAQIRG